MDNTTTLPDELKGLPSNHVRVLDFTTVRDQSRPLHRRTDIAIGPGGKQIWKTGSEIK